MWVFYCFRPLETSIITATDKIPTPRSAGSVRAKRIVGRMRIKKIFDRHRDYVCIYKTEKIKNKNRRRNTYSIDIYYVDDNYIHRGRVVQNEFRLPRASPSPAPTSWGLWNIRRPWRNHLYTMEEIPRRAEGFSPTENSEAAVSRACLVSCQYIRRR